MIKFQLEFQTPNPPSKERLVKYAETISSVHNEFLDGQDLYANATIYDIKESMPLMMIKISYEAARRDVKINDSLNKSELNLLEKWQRKAHQQPYCYFAVNILKNDNVYMIRPNLSDLWSEQMGSYDSDTLLMQILDSAFKEKEAKYA